MNRYRGVDVRSNPRISSADSVASYNSLVPRKVNNYANSQASYQSRGHTMKPVRPNSNVYLVSDDLNSPQQKALMLEEALLSKDGTTAELYVKQLQHQLSNAGATQDMTDNFAKEFIQSQPRDNDEAFQILLKKARRDRMYNWIKKQSSRPIQGFDTVNSYGADGNSTISSLSQADVNRNKQNVSAFDDALDRMKLEIASSAVNNTDLGDVKAAQIADPVFAVLKEVTTDQNILNKVHGTLQQILVSTPRGNDFKDPEILNQKEAIIENLFALIPPVEQSDDGTATVVLTVTNDPSEEIYNTSSSAPLGVFSSENKDMIDDEIKTVDLSRGTYPTPSSSSRTPFPVTSGPGSLYSSADTDDAASTVFNNNNNRSGFPVSSNSRTFPTPGPGSLYSSADTDDAASTVIMNNPRSAYPVSSLSGGGGGYPVNSSSSSVPSPQETQLRSQIGDLERQLDTLRNQQRGTIKNYRDTNNKLTAANDRLSALEQDLLKARDDYNKMVSDGQQIISDFDQKNKSLLRDGESRVNSLTNDLLQATRNRDQLKSLVDDLQRDNQTLNGKIAQLNIDLESLRRQISDLNLRIQSSEGAREKLQDDLNVARKALIDTKNQHAADMHQALNDLRSKLDLKNTGSLDQLKNLLDTSRTQLLKEQEEHQKDRLNYQRELGELNTQFSSLKNSTNGTQREIARLEEEKRLAGANVTGLQDKLNNLIADRDSKITEMNNKNAGLNRQVGELSKKINDLTREWNAKEDAYNQTVRDREKIIQNLNFRIKDLENQLAGLEGVNKNLKQAEIQVNAQLNDVRNKLNDQTAAFNKIQNDLHIKAMEDKAHVTEIATLKTDIEFKDRTINDLNIKISALKPNPGGSDEEKKLHAEITQLRTIKFDLEQRINKLIGDNDIARLNFEDLEKRFNQLNDQKTQLETQVLNLEETIRQLQNNRSTQNALQDALDSVSQLQTLQIEKNSKISELQYQMQSVTQTLGFRDQDIKRLNNEIQTLRDEKYNTNIPMAVDNTEEEIKRLRNELQDVLNENSNLKIDNLTLQRNAGSSNAGTLEIERLKKQINDLRNDLIEARASALRVIPSSSSSSTFSWSRSSSSSSSAANVKQFLAVIANAY